MSQLPLKLPSDQMQTKWKSVLDPVIAYVNKQIKTPTPVSSASSSSFNIVSKSSTYSAAINDYVIASGASFTITLPDATKYSGQQLGIQHNGTSLSQVYTLNTKSGQTIGGVVSGGYALYTNSENLILLSDGSNWQVYQHKATTERTPYSPIFTGLGSPTSINFFWWREGQEMNVFGAAISGSTATTKGTISIPSNSSIDSSFLGFSSNTDTQSGDNVGNFLTSQGYESGYMITAPATTKTAVYFSKTIVNNSVTNIPSTSILNFTMGPSHSFTSFFQIPIQGWQP